MPEMPAPTMSTSTCSRGSEVMGIQVAWVRRRVDRINTVSITSTSSRLLTHMATRATRGRRTPKMSGDDRERAILEAFEHLLEQRALHEISIDEIARGAGISRPTFYFYFASKEAVLLSLFE